MNNFLQKVEDQYGETGFLLVVFLVLTCLLITLMVWLYLIVEVSVLFAAAPFIVLVLIYNRVSSNQQKGNKHD